MAEVVRSGTVTVEDDSSTEGGACLRGKVECDVEEVTEEGVLVSKENATA